MPGWPTPRGRRRRPPCHGARCEESNLGPRQQGAAGADHHRGITVECPCRAPPHQEQPGQASEGAQPTEGRQTAARGRMGSLLTCWPAIRPPCTPSHRAESSERRSTCFDSCCDVTVHECTCLYIINSQPPVRRECTRFGLLGAFRVQKKPTAFESIFSPGEGAAGGQRTYRKERKIKKEPL